LQSLIDASEAGELDAEIAVVISDNPEAQALQRAGRHNIEAVVVDKDDYAEREEMEEELARVIDERCIDLIVLAGYMLILGETFVKKHYGRIMNVHPSLLPAFRGLEAQEQALNYGVKVSGCTVHFVDTGVDTGPIILQTAVPVREDDTVDTLSARILEEEHKALPQAVQLFSEGRLELEGRRVRVLEEPKQEGTV
jgi:phosphoribosylglycinamide formyltransferase-1